MHIFPFLLSNFEGPMCHSSVHPVFLYLSPCCRPQQKGKIGHNWTHSYTFLPLSADFLSSSSDDKCDDCSSPVFNHLKSAIFIPLSSTASPWSKNSGRGKGGDVHFIHWCSVISCERTCGAVGAARARQQQVWPPYNYVAGLRNRRMELNEGVTASS